MMLRVVVDTNLWIRGLLGGAGHASRLGGMASWQAAIVVSQPLIDELTQVCSAAAA